MPRGSTAAAVTTTTTTEVVYRVDFPAANAYVQLLREKWVAEMAVQQKQIDAMKDQLVATNVTRQQLIKILQDIVS